MSLEESYEKCLEEEKQKALALEFLCAKSLVPKLEVTYDGPYECEYF